jgi:hypothetical protein
MMLAWKQAVGKRSERWKQRYSTMTNPIPEIVAALDAKIAATPETVVMEIPCPDGRQGCLVFHQRPIPNPDYLALVQARETVTRTRTGGKLILLRRRSFWILFAGFSVFHLSEDMLWAVIARYTTVPMWAIIIGIFIWAFLSTLFAHKFKIGHDHLPPKGKE